MYKYCVKCGYKCLEKDRFCTKCGTQLVQNVNFSSDRYQNDFEKQVADTYENSQPKDNYYETKYQSRNYSQDYLEQKNYSKNPKNTKSLYTIVGVIAIVGMLIAIWYFVPIIDNGENIKIIKEGPKVSLQSLANGNTLTIPEIGYTGVYGYYISGFKLGELSFTSEGLEFYNGEQCIKITGVGYYSSNTYFEDITTNTFSFNAITTDEITSITYTYDAYISNDNYELKYFHLNLNYELPSSMDDYIEVDMDMDLTITFDKEKNEITYIYSGFSDYNSPIILKVSDEYWDISNMFEELYVGYENQYSYTMDYEGTEADVTIAFKVICKEDVTVPAGTYKNCYKVEYGESYDNIFTSSSIVWVSEDGVVPKMDLVSSYASYYSSEPYLQLKLISYSKN